MNPLIKDFKECAHQAGEICSLTNGYLIRKLGLDDFLVNKVTDSDSVADIAVKALEYFCDEADPFNEKFKFGVLAVGEFLREKLTASPQLPQQSLRDLVAILKTGFNERHVRDWIRSHFS